MTKKITLDGLKDLEFNTSFFKLTCDIGYSYTDNKGKFIDKMTKDYKIVSFKDAGETLIFYGLFEGRLDIRVTPRFIQGQFSKFDSFDEISHKIKTLLGDLTKFLEVKDITSFGWMYSGIYETDDNNIINKLCSNLSEDINVGNINMSYTPSDLEEINIKLSMVKGKIKKSDTDEKDIRGVLADTDYIISNSNWEKSLDTIKKYFSYKDSKALSVLRNML